MFTVIGILSILAGCFVFRQASLLSALSNIVANGNTVAGSFVFVAIALILSGALALASKSGEKRGFIKACAWIYGIGCLMAAVNYGVGDLTMWTFVCGALCIFLIVWLKRHPAY